MSLADQLRNLPKARVPESAGTRAPDTPSARAHGSACTCGNTVNMLDGSGTSCSICGHGSCSAECGNRHYYTVHERNTPRAQVWFADHPEPESASARVPAAPSAQEREAASPREPVVVSAQAAAAPSARVPEAASAQVPRLAVEPKVGKRSDVENYKAVKVFLPIDLHLDAKHKAVRAGYKEFSSLVEQLVREWYLRT